MTAPVTSAVAEINAEIAAIQARIGALGAAARASSTASSSASASSFANTLAGISDTTAATATSTDSSASNGATGAAIVDAAKSYLGTPYVWGAESHSGIDCSGLVQASLRAVGIHVPRVAADQQHAGTPVASLKDAQPGDLLFFGDPAYHVAIYLGNNQLIESPEPGKTVHITDVYQTPTSIRRVAPAADAGSGAASATSLVAAGINTAVADYADQFAAAEARFQLPSGLLAAVAQQESGGNPGAVSPAGARGLMQLMPATAAGLGVNPDDPAQAISAAAKILHGNLARFGSIPLALAAYNAGAGAVQQYGGVPPYTETQNYVRSIMAMLRAGG